MKLHPFSELRDGEVVRLLYVTEEEFERLQWFIDTNYIPPSHHEETRG